MFPELKSLLWMTVCQLINKKKTEDFALNAKVCQLIKKKKTNRQSWNNFNMLIMSWICWFAPFHWNYNVQNQNNETAVRLAQYCQCNKCTIYVYVNCDIRTRFSVAYNQGLFNCLTQGNKHTDVKKLGVSTN